MAGADRQEDILKGWLVRAGQLALTVAVTWFIVDRVGLDLAALADLGPAAWTPDALLFTVASVLLLAGYFLAASVWGLIVRELGGPSIPAGEAIRLFMIANLGRYIPGKVWQIAGLAALAKGRGVSAMTATGAAVLGQGLALVAAAAVGMGAFLAGPEEFRRWGMVGAIVVVVGVVLVSIPRVFARLARFWFRLSRTESQDPVGSLHGLRWLALLGFSWILQAGAFWVLALSLDLEGALVPVASAFAAAYVLGYAMIFAPAGLGPREGFLILFLTPHFGATSSGVIAVVSRLWTTLVELVPAGLFWMRHLAADRGAIPESTSGGGNS